MSTMMSGGLMHTRRVVSPLQFLVLIQLSKEPKYGYEILKSLREEFDGIWNIKTGTFYPALRSLESRGFVKTEFRDETEYYNLTKKGSTLLDSVGGRIASEHKVTDKYFQTLIKWMPLRLKRRVIDRIGFMASLPINIYEDLPKLLNGISYEEKKDFLENLLGFIRNNLSEVEKVYQAIQEEAP